jgi:hypothetical protein
MISVDKCRVHFNERYLHIYKLAQKSVSVYGGVAYLDSSGVSLYFPGNFLISFQQLIFRHFVANHSQVIVLHRLLFNIIQLDF